MSTDKIAALYVFCMDYHSGQSSRLYRLLSKLNTQYKVRLSDWAIKSINGSLDNEPNPESEWYEAQVIYRQLEKNRINQKY